MGVWMATEFFSGQQSEGKELVPQHLKMDGWNTTLGGDTYSQGRSVFFREGNI